MSTLIAWIHLQLLEITDAIIVSLYFTWETINVL